MKSPLKDKPLRNPGQSGDEYIHNYLLDNITPIVVNLFSSRISRYLSGNMWATMLPHNNNLITVIAVSFGDLRRGENILFLERNLNSLRLGRDGEIAVGQYL